MPFIPDKEQRPTPSFVADVPRTPAITGVTPSFVPDEPHKPTPSFIADLTIPLWSKATEGFVAGVGDLLSTSGTVLGWMGAKKLSEKSRALGVQLRTRYIPPERPEEFSWKSVLDPEWWATSVSRAVPFTLSLVPAAILGAYGGVKMATIAGLGAFGKTVLGSLGGAALSRPIESALEAAGAHEQMIARGRTEQEAERSANKVFWDNMKLVGLDAAQFIIAFAPIKGFGPIFKGALSRRILSVGRVGARIGVTGAVEAGEEGYQDIIQRRAIGEKVTLDPQMSEAMAIGAIFGAGLGTAGSVYTSLVQKIRRNMPPGMTIDLERIKAEELRKGIPEQQAELNALDRIAETDEGRVVIESAVEDLKTKAKAVEPIPADEAEAYEAWLRERMPTIRPELEVPLHPTPPHVIEEELAQVPAPEPSTIPPTPEHIKPIPEPIRKITDFTLSPHIPISVTATDALVILRTQDPEKIRDLVGRIENAKTTYPTLVSDFTLLADSIKASFPEAFLTLHDRLGNPIYQHLQYDVAYRVGETMVYGPMSGRDIFSAHQTGRIPDGRPFSFIYADLRPAQTPYLPEVAIAEQEIAKKAAIEDVQKEPEQELISGVGETVNPTEATMEAEVEDILSGKPVPTITRAQQRAIFLYAQRKGLTPRQMSRLRKVLTEATTFRLAPLGRGEVVMTRKEAADFIRAIRHVVKPPYKPPVIPRTARMTPEGFFEWIASLPDIGITRLGPIRYWTDTYQAKTGIPIRTQIVEPVENADQQTKAARIYWFDRMRKAFGDTLHQSESLKILTSYLDNPLSEDPTSADGIKLATELNLSDVEYEAAKRLRAMTKELFDYFDWLGPEKYVKGYWSRIRPREGFRAHYPRYEYVPDELRWFADLERAGILSPKETDAFTIFSTYLNAGIRKKFFQPVLEKIKPIRALLPRNVSQGIDAYLQEKLFGGKRGMMLAEATMDNIFRSLKIELHPETKDAFRHLYFLSTYGGALAYRIMPIIRNLIVQPIGMLLPEVGPRWWAKGVEAVVKPESWRKARREGWLPYMGVPYAEMIASKLELGKLTAPLEIWRKILKIGMMPYGQFADSVGRIMGIGAVEARFNHYLSLYKKGKINFKTFARGIDLDGAPITLQPEIERLVKEGRADEALRLQTREVIDGIFYPYRRGSEILVGVSAGKYFGQFGVWPTEFAFNLARRWIGRGQFDKLALFGIVGAIIVGTLRKLGVHPRRFYALDAILNPTLAPLPQLTVSSIELMQSLYYGNRRLIDRNIGKMLSTLRIFLPAGIAVSEVADFWRAEADNWMIRDKITGKPLYQSSPTEELMKMFGFTTVKEMEVRRFLTQRRNVVYTVQKLNRKIKQLYLQRRGREARDLDDWKIMKYSELYKNATGTALKRITPGEAYRWERKRRREIYESPAFE